MSLLKTLRKRAAKANAEHRCASCFKRLPVLTPEQLQQARQSGYEQGMTDEQMDDPENGVKVCDECWRVWERKGFPGMTRPN